MKYWEKAVLELGRVSKTFIFPFQNATALTSTSQEDSAELVRFLLLSFGDVIKPLDLFSMTVFNFHNLLYNMNVTVLLQGATPLPPQEDSAELVSKILTIKLWRCKKDPRSVFFNDNIISTLIHYCRAQQLALYKKIGVNR